MPARVLPLAAATALHDRAATRRIEQAAQAALPPFTLMARAGLATARLARALAPHARRAWIAAGPGNNGGDGLEAAVHLRAAGLAVHVTLAAAPARLPADARTAWLRAVDAGVTVSRALPTEPPGPDDIALDAVLGLGATRAPEGELATLVLHLNALRCTVLAIDLPSGLDTDTGQPSGEPGVRAAHTLSLLTLKPGLFTAAGRDTAGEVWFDDLGVDTGAEPATAWLAGAPPHARREHAQHKGSFGDVLVVGGGAGMAGAAVLAARAAHAAGAGRVHVDLLDPSALTHDLVRPELMFRPASRQHTLPAHATVVAGCGAGDAIEAALPRLLDEAERLVLDADALNAVARDAGLQARLAARLGRGQATILTPHPLEAARLLGRDTGAVQSDRLGAAQQLAHRCQAVVVLKGSGSVIAAPGGAPTLNPTGNASLATAGTGDVLAGWIGGRWAIGGTPAPQATVAAGSGESPALAAALQAAISGTWQHGQAADGSLHTPLRAADLVEALHAMQRR